MPILPVSLSLLKKMVSSTFWASSNNYMVARGFPLQKIRYLFLKLLVQIVTNGRQKVSVQRLNFIGLFIRLGYNISVWGPVNPTY